jgi:hypothetical protein
MSPYLIERFVKDKRLIRLRYAELQGDHHEQAVIAIETYPNGSMALAVDYYVFEYRTGGRINYSTGGRKGQRRSV